MRNCEETKRIPPSEDCDKSSGISIRTSNSATTAGDGLTPQVYGEGDESCVFGNPKR